MQRMQSFQSFDSPATQAVATQASAVQVPAPVVTAMPVAPSMRALPVQVEQPSMTEDASATPQTEPAEPLAGVAAAGIATPRPEVSAAVAVLAATEPVIEEHPATPVTVPAVPTGVPATATQAQASIEPVTPPVPPQARRRATDDDLIRAKAVVEAARQKLMEYVRRFKRYVLKLTLSQARQAWLA